MAFAWPRPQPEPRVEEHSALAFRSPGLRLLAEKLSSPGKHDVLDLGAPRDANVQYFREFKCRLRLEDVYQELRNFPPSGALEDDAQALAMRREEVIARALTCDPGAKFDVVMGWDLFNYLSPDAIGGLMDRVARHCRPGTLFFLIMSTHSSIVAEPAHVAARPDGVIAYEPLTECRVSCPAYLPLSLEKMMPGFHLLHSFLLGERMQDYLFSYR